MLNVVLVRRAGQKGPAQNDPVPKGPRSKWPVAKTARSKLPEHKTTKSQKGPRTKQPLSKRLEDKAYNQNEPGAQGVALSVLHIANEYYILHGVGKNFIYE